MDLSVKEAIILSIDNGDYPEVFPIDYGTDLILKDNPEIKPRVRNPRTVKIDITTFGVMHYYADILADGIDLIEEENGVLKIVGGYVSNEFSKICEKNRGKYQSQYRIEVLRFVTKEEKEKYPIRWKGYYPGDTTKAFYSEEEALQQALKIVKARFGKGWVLKLENETITL